MPNINITVREKIAHTIGNPHIVCGNSDYVVHFDFDAEWDAYETKTARFIWGGKYTDVLFEGTECPAPVIMDAYGVLVGVYAGDLHTTTAAAIDTDKSILSGDGLPADPLPDVYAQIIAKLADAKTLSGDGVPTTDTEGAVGQMYYDKTGKRLYVCTDTTSGYTWQAIEAEAAVDVDDTLTKAGKAADAKAVGDKIDEVDEKVAGKLGEKELADAIDTALAQAKESGAFDGGKGEPGADGKDGKPGIDGKDGITPHVGENGNWYIGDTDTGVRAQGNKGEPGADGHPGADGQSGTDGQDGVTPHIGENGNWWIGTTDTGVSATGGSDKSLKWVRIYANTLAEIQNNVVISADASGKAIADYNSLALNLILSVPADSTQESSSGSVWVYPSATIKNNSLRVSMNVASWKTTQRNLGCAFIGGKYTMIAAANSSVAIPSYMTDGYALDGINICIHNANDHLPIGTHIEVEILCEVKQ